MGPRRTSDERLPQVNRRMTRQLDATYRALCQASDHPSSEQVFESVRVELPEISLGTVYRNLQKLVSEGRAQVVQVSNRSARYDGRVDRHDHFVCSRCQVVIDVCASSAFPGRRRRVAGHRVGSHTLTYFGVCRDCEAAGKAAE